MNDSKNPARNIELSHSDIEEGVGYVQLSGGLDIVAVQEICLRFTTLTSTQRRPTIIDLSKVTLITSIGVGMLITNANTLRAEGKVLIILSPSPKVEKVLMLANVSEVLPIEHDLEAALIRARKAL